ncbi:MAG: acetylxylan esterase [Thermoguttaceae bacterium]
MHIQRVLALATMATAILIPTAATDAMNHNLVWPWNDKCSPPQTAYLAFHSPQSADMLFDRASLGSGQSSLEFVCQAGLRSVGLTWTLHRNMVAKPFRSGQAQPLPANRFCMRIVPEGLPPGFYDLKVVLDTGMQTIDPKDERPVRGVCVFGWRAAEMAVQDSRPADFKAFWERAKARLAAIPLDVRNETPMQSFNRAGINAYNLKSACLPADYDPQGHKVEEVESCKISFAGPDGGRVYAWLAKPKGAGPFPAMLVLPGAGFTARPRPLEHARHGYLAIDVQIHGQDVDLPKYPTLPGYYDGFQFEPPEAYYYYNVHLRVVQVVNYLASRPDVDARRIVAVGGSQGGRLSIVVAGLDRRIAAAVAAIANSPNYPHLHWVARCNGLDKPWDYPLDPKLKDRIKSDGMDLAGQPPAVTDPDGRCFAYYDPMNFAPDIRCPVLMNAGMIDPASPPFSVWAVYNRLASRHKALIPQPGLAHDWSAEFDRRAWHWLEKLWLEKP